MPDSEPGAQQLRKLNATSPKDAPLIEDINSIFNEFNQQRKSCTFPTVRANRLLNDIAIKHLIESFNKPEFKYTIKDKYIYWGNSSEKEFIYNLIQTYTVILRNSLKIKTSLNEYDLLHSAIDSFIYFSLYLPRYYKFSLHPDSKYKGIKNMEIIVLYSGNKAYLVAQKNEVRHATKISEWETWVPDITPRSMQSILLEGVE